MGFGIPVIVYEEGVELPNEGTYYVIASNGTFMRKDMDLVSGFVPVQDVPFLKDLEAGLWVESRIPKVPAQHIIKIKEFFRRVVAEFESEACTVLFYNEEIDNWKVFASLQVVSHGGVKYRRGQEHVGTSEYEGYHRVGTIHSHCDFGSFHSGTDIGDEMDFDGIHGTFGHNDRENFSITSSIVINNHRMEVDPLTLFEGIGCNEGETDRYHIMAATEHREFYEQSIDEWMEQVREWGNRDWGEAIVVGNKVAWAGETKVMRDEYGDGPFEVCSTKDGMIGFQTGSENDEFRPAVVLPASLFRKVVR